MVSNGIMVSNTNPNINAVRGPRVHISVSIIFQHWLAGWFYSGPGDYFRIGCNNQKDYLQIASIFQTQHNKDTRGDILETVLPREKILNIITNTDITKTRSDLNYKSNFHIVDISNKNSDGVCPYVCPLSNVLLGSFTKSLSVLICWKKHCGND